MIDRSGDRREAQPSGSAYLARSTLLRSACAAVDPDGIGTRSGTADVVVAMDVLARAARRPVRTGGHRVGVGLTADRGMPELVTPHLPRILA